MRRALWIAGSVCWGLVFTGVCAEEPGQQAYTKLCRGDELQRQGKISEASAVYLEASKLYEQALLKKPEDKTLKQNYTYCLGSRGYFQIQQAQQLLDKKEYGPAASAFDGAISAYKYALEKLPGEKGFQDNLKYARYHGGFARYQAKLASRGPAYAFALSAEEGKKVSLASFKGKTVLIEFMAGWCPACRESLPMLGEIGKYFSGKPVQVLILSVDRVDQWKKSGYDKKTIELTKSLPIPMAWADEETYYQYGSFSSIPAMILVDSKGNIREQVASDNQTRDYLISRIKSML